MRSIILAVAVIVVAPQACPETHPPLSAAHRFFIANERLQPIRRVRDLPAGVRSALRAVLHEPVLEVADPGMPLGEMHDAPGTALPARRLIVAGCGPYHCLVQYERAGFRPSFPVLLFGRLERRVTLEWTGAARGPVGNVRELRTLVLAGALNGHVPY